MTIGARWNQIAHPRLLVVGDLMLDRYVWGEAERISPEAPVLVLREDLDEVRPGGAANVASFLRQLDAEVFVAGVVGEDADGRMLKRLMSDVKIDTSLMLTDSGRPTTSKQRFVGRAAQRQPHQILRVDRESRAPLSNELERDLVERITTVISSCAAVLISDHAKGVCTASLLRRLIDLARCREIPILIDPSCGADYENYARATLITPNRVAAEKACVADNEFNLAQRAHSSNPEDADRVTGTAFSLRDPRNAQDAARYLRDRLQLDAVVLTLDRDGLAFATSDETGLVPCRTRDVCDVTGAGDMVLAVLGLCQAEQIPLVDSLHVANAAAGLEVERFGVEALSRAEISAELARVEYGSAPETPRGDMAGRYISADEAVTVVRHLQAMGQRVVMANGCFDMVHRGHVSLLTFARQQGDALIVALNSDKSVKRLKGSDRPICPLEQRIEVLSALRSVDYIVSFEADTPADLLSMIKPDVLVKGADYFGRQIAGSEFCGRVAIAPLIPGISTTAIIDSIHTSMTVHGEQHADQPRIAVIEGTAVKGISQQN